MPTAPATFHPSNQSGTEREAERKREFDRYRLSSHERGYDHRWRQYRKSFLRRHPLCLRCKDEGIITAAVIVDHIRPHKQDNTLFWAKDNHQPLCKPCHDRKTATEDSNFA